jgi:hypothetical protein
MTGSRALALSLAFAFAFATSAQAALTAYYTLDNLGAGIQNLGSDGFTSDLSAPNAGATPVVVAGLLGSGALRFDGNDLLRNLGPGNAADDLAGYPFTMSLWVNSVVVDTTRDTVFTISNRTPGDMYYGTGVQAVSGRAEPELVRRNTAFTEVNAASTTDASGPGWVNIVSVFGLTSAQLYVNGKLSGTGGAPPSFVGALDTINIGGFLRNGSTTTPTDPFSGIADDIGLFDIGLAASDAALINGLGQLGGIGLDAWDAAQALNAMSIGSVAQVGGFDWQKVGGLAGTTGDFGGSIVGEDAYIVTANDGTGIQLIPEPATGVILASGLSLLFGSRRTRRS